MLGVHSPKTMIEDNRASCQLEPMLKLVHVLQVSDTHSGNPRIIMTARILRNVPEHAAIQKLPSEALAVLQQNLGEIVEVSMLKSLRSFSINLQASDCKLFLCHISLHVHSMMQSDMMCVGAHYTRMTALHIQ